MQEAPLCVNLEEQIQKNRDNRPPSGRGGQRRERNTDRRENQYFSGGRRNNNDRNAPWSHDLYKQDRGDRSERFSGRRRSNATIIITSLHYSVTEPELRELAEKYGDVKKCHVQWDNIGRSKETAEIEYFNESDAKTAAEALDGLKVESLPMKANLIEQGEDDGQERRRYRGNGDRNNRNNRNNRNDRFDNNDNDNDNNDNDNQNNNNNNHNYRQDRNDNYNNRNDNNRNNNNNNNRNDGINRRFIRKRW